MKNRILVTGGAGYIGSVFVPQLLGKGYQVTVLDNFMYKQNSLLDVCYHPNLEIIVGDVRDEEFFKNQVETHDIIIPLAAIVGAPACNKDKPLATEINQKLQLPKATVHRLCAALEANQFLQKELGCTRLQPGRQLRRLAMGVIANEHF